VKVVALPEVEHRERASVAVGTFDGVHLGHREVIDHCESVLTFEPHPVSVVAPQHTPRLLTRPERKAELIAALGVQELVVIPFDAAFASRSAEEFIDQVLVDALQAKQVSIGENFRFGHRAQGGRAPAARGARRDRVLESHPRPRAGRRRRRGEPSAGRAVPALRDRRAGR
jgi:riboflavin kinase/FMN adenylyltransferase